MHKMMFRTDQSGRLFYADILIRVLVLGFVLLVVMTLTDLRKLGASRQPEQPARPLAVRKAINKLQLSDAIASSLKSLAEDGVDSTVTEDGLQIVLQETLLYSSGKASISTEGLNLLDRISGILKESEGAVRVEGHTDNEPIRYATAFSSNYQLSMARALRVANYFVEKGGVAAQRVSATGFGDLKPRFPNDTPEDRGKNRRVEIILETDKKGIR